MNLDPDRFANFFCNAVEAQRGQCFESEAAVGDVIGDAGLVTAICARRSLDAQTEHAALAALSRLYEVPPLLSPAKNRLRLSVVICTRNRAALLERCLAAVAAQERPCDELVVVDNGSSDHTSEVIARSPARRVFLSEPSIPLARNAGARAATGDIICYTDDDAVPDPRWLQAIEQAFLRDERIGIVGGDAAPAPWQRGAIARFFAQYMGGA